MVVYSEIILDILLINFFRRIPLECLKICYKDSFTCVTGILKCWWIFQKYFLRFFLKISPRITLKNLSAIFSKFLQEFQEIIINVFIKINSSIHVPTRDSARKFSTNSFRNCSRSFFFIKPSEIQESPQWLLQKFFQIFC